MSASYICGRCGRTYSMAEYLKDRFCRECGTYLFRKEDRQLSIGAPETYSNLRETLQIKKKSLQTSEWIGRRVSHSRWGEGIVLDQRHGVFELLVEFRNGRRTWLRRSECSLIIPKPAPIMPFPVPKPSKFEPIAPLSEQVYRSRWIIEALRLGIVPTPAVHEFTFGREKEVEQLQRWLDEEEEGCFLLIGEYGSGKTHLVEYTRSLALEKGYAVATCEIDPNECPLHKPKRVYRKLVENFRFNDGRDGFRQFLRLISQKQGETLTENPYISTVVQYLQKAVEWEDLWEWIEGGEVKSLLGSQTMYDYSTASNIYCNILSTLGYAAMKLLNLKGILIMLDEAETLRFPSFYTYQHFMGINFARGLVLVASNDRALSRERVLDLYEPNRIRRGEKTGLRYCASNTMKYIYDYPSGLKILFSLTSVPYMFQDNFLSECGRGLELQRLSNKDKERVFEGIYKFYRTAYSTFIVEGLEEIKGIVLKRSEDNIRSLVKASVEAFDLKRFYPDVPTRKLLK